MAVLGSIHLNVNVCQDAFLRFPFFVSSMSSLRFRRSKNRFLRSKGTAMLGPDRWAAGCTSGQDFQSDKRCGQLGKTRKYHTCIDLYIYLYAYILIIPIMLHISVEFQSIKSFSCASCGAFICWPNFLNTKNWLTISAERFRMMCLVPACYRRLQAGHWSWLPSPSGIFSLADTSKVSGWNVCWILLIVGLVYQDI